MQQKTGKTVYIPMHPLWLAEMHAQPSRCESILVSRFGRAYASTSALQDLIRELMAKDEIATLLDELRGRRAIGSKTTSSSTACGKIRPTSSPKSS